MTDRLKLIDEDKPWYASGLRFKCTECGQCCSGGPGYTWVSKEEIAQIAAHLNLSVKNFGRRYLRYVNGRYALLEIYRPELEVYDCIFLKNNKCTIYLNRPTQCRTFPWWVQNLKSPEDWDEAASYCEGISPIAPLIPFEEIQKVLTS